MIHGFYLEKVAPTLDSLDVNLIKISKGTNTSLYHLVQKLGFKYKKCDKHSVIMESMKIVVWRYKHLIEITKYRAQNYLIVYLEETWYDSHDTEEKIWIDSSKESNLSVPVSKGKRVAICHAGLSEGFVDNALVLCGKDITKCYIEYHRDMNSDISKIWFHDKLIPNIYKDRKTLIVLDNATYHCRLMGKTP